MSDDGVPDQRSRARLEAIVFGRDAAVSDAERADAEEMLARLVEEERRSAAEAETARSQPAVPTTEVQNVRPNEGVDPLQPEDRGRVRGSRWRRLLLAAAIAIAVVVVGVAARVLVFGWQPFGTSDSMTIFDRPQTERDLEFPDLGNPNLIDDSFRFVGSEGGFDVYVYQSEAPEFSPIQETLFCLMVVDHENPLGGSCASAAEFSTGPVNDRFPHTGGWADVSWDIRSGVTVTTGTYAPSPPPLAVFDEDQDDADLNALLYLPDIPPSQQDTVRFLSSSAGYFVAAYRDADDAVCLAVYEGDTTVATGESVCITEAEFEEAGIQVIYPSAAPEISVTWGQAGVAFGGR